MWLIGRLMQEKEKKKNETNMKKIDVKAKPYREDQKKNLVRAKMYIPVGGFNSEISFLLQLD